MNRESTLQTSRTGCAGWGTRARVSREVTFRESALSVWPSLGVPLGTFKPCAWGYARGQAPGAPGPKVTSVLTRRAQGAGSKAGVERTQTE